MQKKIYLIRHTQPEVSKGYIYGQTDLDVTDTFEQEAALIREVLPNHQSMSLYTSPLQRCLKLARYLSGGSIHSDERLKEMDFGDWEMKRWNELDAAVLKEWMENLGNQAAPGGESHRELGNRVWDFWEEIIHKPETEIGIISHYGVILSLLSHLLHIPVKKVFQMDLNYGTVIRISLHEADKYKILFLK